MIITKQMQEELEKEGYSIEDFKDAVNRKDITSEMRQVYIRAKENYEKDQMENKDTKEEPAEIDSKQKKSTWSEKLYEANQTLGFAENQVYVLDKGCAMDMAADYAKKRGFSKRAVMEAVAEVVDGRSNDYYGAQTIEQDKMVEEKEDLIAEEEENDRFAYPDIDDYTYTLERTKYNQ